MFLISRRLATPLINAKELFHKFNAHVLDCKSSDFLLATNAAFESWFRVELIPVLGDLGYSMTEISTNYTYPNSNDKADLCIQTTNGNIVFELKSFVSGQDSNKKESYPYQIRKLEELVETRKCMQALGFTTFIGYSESRMRNYMNNFFKNSKWQIIEPQKISPKGDLCLSISTLNL